MGQLIVVRHGKSEYNALGLWTGHTDVSITDEGREEARRAGAAIGNVEIHIAHTSCLTRTHQTFEEIRTALGQTELRAEAHEALNERHYGAYTGKNKWQVKDEVGEATFQRIRRSWDEPIPEGESLKDVHARVVPHYETQIKPHLMEGKNVLIVSHGNTLRALVKHLDQIADDEIAELEIGTGEVHCYHIEADGSVAQREVRTTALVELPAYA